MNQAKILDAHAVESLSASAEAVKTLLVGIGEDLEREGIKNTPMRFAKALKYFTKGYRMTLEGNGCSCRFFFNFVAEVINNAIFQSDSDEMVIMRNIDVFSMCEHHMVPFHGKVHIGYIPNGKIIGLSKLVRVTELFSRRLQVQERLTHQISNTLLNVLEPAGVGVVMECTFVPLFFASFLRTSSVLPQSHVHDDAWSGKKWCNDVHKQHVGLFSK